MCEAFILRLYSLKEPGGTQENIICIFFLFFFFSLGTTSESLHFLMLISESSVSGSPASYSSFPPLLFKWFCKSEELSGSSMKSKIMCWTTKLTVKMAGRTHLKRYMPGLFRECEA